MGELWWVRCGAVWGVGWLVAQDVSWQGLPTSPARTDQSLVAAQASPRLEPDPQGPVILL